MAFDQTIRNRLARFVADTRSLLAEEFTRQLQNEYGLDPVSGEATPLENLTHLDDSRRETASLLRETMTHYLASSDCSTPAKEKKARQDVLNRIVREQAFTVLNRLCALRMAEARGILIESLARGFQSKGFQLYQRIAGTAMGETGAAYQQFLFSIFDEFALDLSALFDRYSPQGRLFPKEAILLQVLDEINHPDIDPLWAEDETIGWIYQYFNSIEERRQMRAESQAPRNSRELAVRNQFFTPRYVVEFLTDNTLGRLWYEMTQGKTTLVDSCRYLVCRPNEIFFAPSHQRYALEKDDWVKKVAQTGDFSLLPEDPTLQEIERFALMIDGYGAIKHIESQTHRNNEDDIQKFADRMLNPRLEELEKKQKTIWKGSSLELWCCLFMVQRHFWKEGFTFSKTRSEERAFSKQEPALFSLWMALRKELIASNSEDTQEQLLRQPLYIPHRLIKDPRDIKMLDPACGSMHFGLYAFDLFEKIYDEAWDIEETNGNDALSRSGDLQPLTQEYLDKESFLRDVPRLIIERNIHGVDIDPRAAQIAGLSLWLRAQRSWLKENVRPTDRPQIRKSNVVCAEPMPGETDMLEEFTASLQPKLLGQLLKIIFEKMKLAGEAGTLLKIEDEIREAIADAHAEYRKFVLSQRDDETHLPGLAPEREATLFDFADIARPEDFWKTAEHRLIKAIKEYAEQASQNGEQRRLFATDAARGFAFIDICRKQYDVAVMNPPFGLVSEKSKEYFQNKYPNDWTEIYACFVSRVLDITSKTHGKIGAITSSLWLYTKHQLQMRLRLGNSAKLEIFIDVGGGVLDGATVDTGLLIASSQKCDGRHTVYYYDSHSVPENQNESAIQKAKWRLLPIKLYMNLPLSPFCFHVETKRIAMWSKFASLEPSVATVVTGNSTFDNFRFLRLHTEINNIEEGEREKWIPYDKGGHFQPFFNPTPLLWNYANQAREDCFFEIGMRGTDAQVRQSHSSWGKKGLCYSRATSVGFSPRILPEHSVMNEKSISIFPHKDQDLLKLLSILASTYTQDLLDAFGRHRNIENRAVGGLPIDENALKDEALSDFSIQAISHMKKLESFLEISPVFVRPPFRAEAEEIIENLACLYDQLDATVEAIFYSEKTKPVSVPRSLLIRKYMTVRFNWNSENDFRNAWWSYIIGCAFFHWRVAPTVDDPINKDNVFSALPRVAPARNTTPSRDPILVDSPGDKHDIVTACERVAPILHDLFPEEKIPSLEITRDFIRDEFFDYHYSLYSSISGRNAPIYWPLSIKSESYTIWVYYNSLTTQTLYTCVNDFAEPKLKQTTEEAARLQVKNNRSSTEDRELEKLLDLEQELTDFRDELLRVAQFWKPNLNDGVEITAAPLWKLFRHRQWSARLKGTWEKLEAGEYDWAHLALSIWPDRVVRASLKDHSYAIAHDLEDQLWQEVKVTKTGRGGRVTETMEWQPRKLTEMEIHAIVEEVKKR